jgi:outer membrane lipoprotein carrier protein
MQMKKLKCHAMPFGKPAAAFFLFFFFHSAWAAEPGAIIEGMQRRYSSVSTIRGNFQQTYRAPGIEQFESGTFTIKKPGLMRWEYRQPEEKLFIADGKESFLFIPRDRQVTVQPFSLSDMHNTPLEFFLGSGDFSKNFIPSWDSDFKPKSERSAMIRLTPRKIQPEYAFLVLELNRENYEIHGIIIREPSGNTSRFAFTDLAANVKVNNRDFQFKTPKGVEEIRFTDDER